MTTLKLKKYSKANYGINFGDLSIKVVNPYKSNGMGSDAWNIVIEFYNGRDEDYIYVSEYFETKKQASIFGAKWVENNL